MSVPIDLQSTEISEFRITNVKLVAEVDQFIEPANQRQTVLPTKDCPLLSNKTIWGALPLHSSIMVKSTRSEDAASMPPDKSMAAPSGDEMSELPVAKLHDLACEKQTVRVESVEEPQPRTPETGEVPKRSAEKVTVPIHADSDDAAPPIRKLASAAKETAIVVDALVAEAKQTPTVVDEPTEVARPVPAERITVVFRRAEVNALLKRGEMQVKLDPPELGAMKVKLVSQSGELSARIEVKSEAVRQLVDQNLPALREGLEKSGVRVVQMEVVVSDHDACKEHPKHFRQEQSRPRFQKNSGPELVDGVSSDRSGMSLSTHLGQVNLLA
jgi:flagellar hook-length control protein FliK